MNPSSKPIPELYVQPSRWLVYAILALTGFAIPFEATGFAQSDSSSAPSVEIGFGGHIKLGKWAPISFSFDESSSALPTKFRITVRDGDDTPVVYSGPLAATTKSTRQGWVRIGRARGAIEIELLDDSEVVAFRDSIDFGSDSFELHGSGVKFLATIETTPGLRDLIASKAKKNDSSVFISLSSANQIPAHGFCLEAIDTILLSSHELELLKSLQPKQIESLLDWTKNGGHLVVAAAPEQAALFSDDGLLTKLSPGSVKGKAAIDSSSRFQNFVKITDKLIDDDKDETLAVTEFEPDALTKVELEQSSIPIVMRKPLGVGRVTTVAMNLSSPEFLKWGGAGVFTEKALEEDKTTIGDVGLQSGRVLHYGYEDIVGQLRVPLDQFSKVKFVSFTWVAILIALFVLCVGPGDYFFLKKVVGKMELTWITFTLLTLLFCTIAFLGNRYTKPSDLQINQVEIVDIDHATGAIRGTLWANVYSPKNGNLDIELEEENKLGLNQDSTLFSWQGLPGEGLGGMQTKAINGLLRDAYVTEFTEDGDSNIRSKLVNVPFQVSSSKPFFVQWGGKNELKINSRLRFRSELENTFTNPFDHELKNCRLFYGIYVYVLQNPLQPGETIDMSETLEKNARSHLNRRKTEDNKAVNVPWDPSDTRVDRIGNMLMFYEMGGGEDYTNLTHKYQNFVDMSDQLDFDRVVFVGEMESPASTLKINGKNASDDYDSATTFVRIVLPVEIRTKKKK